MCQVIAVVFILLVPLVLAFVVCCATKPNMDVDEFSSAEEEEDEDVMASSYRGESEK